MLIQVIIKSGSLRSNIDAIYHFIVVEKQTVSITDARNDCFSGTLKNNVFSWFP